MNVFRFGAGLSFVAFLLFSIIAPSEAQLTSNPLLTLWHEDVQEELELTDRQSKEIKELIKEADLGHRKLYEKWEGAFQDKAKSSAIKKDYDDLQARGERRVDEILIPSQVKRLRQLAFRKYMRQNGGGIGALVESKEFLRAMNITPSQKEKLKSRSEEVKNQLVRDIEKLIEKAEVETLKVLSASQQELYKEMVGPTMRPRLGNKKQRLSKDGGKVK